MGAVCHQQLDGGSLTGIGFTLIDLNSILKTLTVPYLLAVAAVVAVITLTAAVLGKLAGFYPLESAIAAGMCTTNMGALEMWPF